MSALRLPVSYYEPQEELPEVPESAIDEAIDAYATNAADLADLAHDNRLLLHAICDYVLNQCDGGSVAAELAIRENPAAMERIEREVIAQLRRAA